MAQVAKRMNETGTPWWVLLMTGGAAFILGLLLLFIPAQTLVVVIQFMGLYWLVTGIVDIVRIFTDHTRWGWKLLSGILGIILGILVLQHPIWSTVLIPTTMILVLAIGGIILGIVGIIQAFRGAGWGAVILGAISIIFGLLLLGNPVFTGLIALPVLLGFFGLFAGLVAMWYAFRVRSIEKRLAEEAAARAAAKSSKGGKGNKGNR